MKDNFFKATFGIVASTGTYVGTAMSRRVDVARRNAVNAAWEALYKGDSAANYCSGIAVEWVTIEYQGRIIHNHMDI
jgi:hypothetical protein